jgi:hypothetical protein
LVGEHMLSRGLANRRSHKGSKMSHQHFCHVAGHYWQCGGTALRGGDTEPSVCVCVCGLPLEGFDHSGCHDPVELLACPEHQEGRQRIEEARKEHDRQRAKTAFMRSGRG